MHRSIREAIFENCGARTARSVRIVYGGSVDANNIGSLIREAGIDGALVGGASLNATFFSSVVNDALDAQAKPDAAKVIRR